MMRWLPGVSLVVRLIIGAMLIYSGWEKLHAFGWWREVVSEMRVIGEPGAGVAAAVLPGIELVVGGALLAGFWRRAAALVAATLFLIFAGVMLSVIARDLQAVCGCFGPDSEYPVTSSHAIMDLGLATLSAAIAFLPPHRLSLDRGEPPARI